MQKKEEGYFYRFNDDGFYKGDMKDGKFNGNGFYLD